MEIDEGLDVGGNQDDKLSGLNEAQGGQEPPAKIRKPRWKLETQLVESAEGLSALYKTFVDDPKQGLQNEKLKIRGKGHELSDFNRIMNAIGSWKHTMAPQYNGETLVGNIQKLTKSKKVQHFMYQLRDCYTENIPSSEVLIRDEPEEQVEKAPVQDFKKHALGFVKAEITKEEAYFRMVDDEKKINTQPNRQQQQNLPPGITAEQMLVMEENRKKALEKKRKRELESLEACDTAPGSKRAPAVQQQPVMAPIDEAEKLENYCADMGFTIVEEIEKAEKKEDGEFAVVYDDVHDENMRADDYDAEEDEEQSLGSDIREMVMDDLDKDWGDL